MKINKERLKKQKFYFINFVIKELDRQTADNYIEVLAQIYDKKMKIKTYGDRRTFMTSFVKVGNHYEGILSNAIFVDPNSSAINGDTYVITNPNIDPNKGLSLKQWDFYFYPKYHRMAIVSGCSLSQVLKFFNEAFVNIFGEMDYITVNIEKERSIIDKIIGSKTIDSIDLELSYSNNDCYDDWTEVMDLDMKNSCTQKAKFSFKALTGHFLDLESTKFIKSLLYLTKSNGSAKARLLNQQGRHEIVNTNDYPKQVQVEFSNDNPSQELNDIASQISNNTDT